MHACTIKWSNTATHDKGAACRHVALATHPEEQGRRVSNERGREIRERKRESWQGEKKSNSEVRGKERKLLIKTGERVAEKRKLTNAGPAGACRGRMYC